MDKLKTFGTVCKVEKGLFLNDYSWVCVSAAVECKRRKLSTPTLLQLWLVLNHYCACGSETGQSSFGLLNTKESHKQLARHVSITRTPWEEEEETPIICHAPRYMWLDGHTKPFRMVQHTKVLLSIPNFICLFSHFRSFKKFIFGALNFN